MQIECWFIGNKNSTEIEVLVQSYLKKIHYYAPIQQIIIPEPKHIHDRIAQQKKITEQVCKKLQPTDGFILLDEHGKNIRSTELSTHIEKWSQHYHRLIFCVGGAYGVDEVLKERAHFMWSLSMLTLPHQIARLVVVEQIYRAYTIQKGSPYHHE